jgi:hypothetical protein
LVCRTEGALDWTLAVTKDFNSKKIIFFLIENETKNRHKKHPLTIGELAPLLGEITQTRADIDAHKIHNLLLFK